MSATWLPNGANRDYSVFGFRVRSELPLPELFPASGEDPPDVTIQLGTTPACKGLGPGIHPLESGVLLVVKGVGRYWIANGSLIVVEPYLGVPEKNVRLFLLGSAMGLLIHQRGLLPLHANAVEMRGRVFAFMGPSGAGKSTLAAWFHDHGCRVIADDVCVVRFDERGRPLASPGLPRLRLWKEVLDATGRQASLYDRSYAGDEIYEKYDVPISGAPIQTAAQSPLAGVYLLGKANRLSVRQLHGVDATEALFANTYRGGFVATAGSSRLHWQACVNVVSYAPIFLFSRTRDFSRFESEAQQILAHVTRLAG